MGDCESSKCAQASSCILGYIITGLQSESFKAVFGNNSHQLKLGVRWCSGIPVVFPEFKLVFRIKSPQQFIYDLRLGIALIPTGLMVKLLSILIEFLYKFLPVNLESTVHSLSLSRGLGVVRCMQSLSNS